MQNGSGSRVTGADCAAGGPPGKHGFLATRAAPSLVVAGRDILTAAVAFAGGGKQGGGAVAGAEHASTNDANAATE
jgi:hypothetical protein